AWRGHGVGNDARSTSMITGRSDNFIGRNTICGRSIGFHSVFLSLRTFPVSPAGQPFHLRLGQLQVVGGEIRPFPLSFPFPALQGKAAETSGAGNVFRRQSEKGVFPE